MLNSFQLRMFYCLSCLKNTTKTNCHLFIQQNSLLEQTQIHNIERETCWLQRNGPFKREKEDTVVNGQR